MFEPILWYTSCYVEPDAMELLSTTEFACSRAHQMRGDTSYEDVTQHTTLGRTLRLQRCSFITLRGQQAPLDDAMTLGTPSSEPWGHIP